MFHRIAKSLSEIVSNVEIIGVETNANKNIKLNYSNISVIKLPQQQGLKGKIFNIITLWKIIKKTNCDYIISSELESWFISIVYSYLYKSSIVIFDSHECFSDYYAERYRGVLKKLVKYIIEKYEKILCYKTDLVTYAKSGCSLDFNKLNVKKINLFNYLPTNKIVREYSLPENKTYKYDCVHIGAFTASRGWPQLLKALNILNNKSLRIAIVGTIREGESTLMAAAEELQVSSNIIFIKSVSYDEIPNILNSSKIGLMLYQPGLVNHKYAFPLKLFDYMACEIPVIGPRYAIDVNNIITECQNGELVNSSSPQEIAKAILSILDNYEKYKIKAKNAVQIMRNNYNWESQFKLLSKYIEKS
jgi:glycosyltransferase involved in cell wall biosynthesis